MQQQPQPMMRRGPPPKFRPFMIIVVVLSLGLLFIGLTLTIIAHWPGYTAIGNNPLKIVGPVLLAVGGISFIGCIVEVVRKGQSDKKNFTRQMQERERMMSFVTRTTRSLPASSQYSLNHPSHAPPMQTYAISGQQHQQQQNQRGILKSTGSQNGNGGSQYGAGDSGVGQTTGYNSSATNASYEPDAASQGSGNGQQMGRFEIHPMPNPNNPNNLSNPTYGNGYPGSQAGGQVRGYSPSQSGQGAFQPVSPSPQGYSGQGQGYGDQGQGYGGQGQGYGGQGQGYGGQGQSNYPMEDATDIPQPVRQRTRDTKKKATANPDIGYNPDGGAGAADYGMSSDSHNSSLVTADVHMAPMPPSHDPSNDPQDREAKRRRRAEKKRQKEMAAMQQQGGGGYQQPGGAAGGGGGYQQQPGGAAGYNNNPLQINIRASPGMNVTITPQGTPNMERHAETDI